MSNMAVFSALMDWKNRFDRKSEAKRLGYVMNNHIIKGGHLSAQPMGALHDYIAIDPVTEKPAVVNFPVCADNPYKMDVEEAKKLLDRYRPELIVFGKSMVLHKEPVAEIRKFVDEQNIHTTIMYDMAHVLGLIGDHFQNPFAEGAELVTGSTHKTFFGPQRGIIGVNYQEDDLKYGLWKTIQSRTFPGSVSNHHLGTQLGMLMAAYEMNHFRDTYQRAVIDNAKSFARSLKAHGLDVAGDPAIDYTETHQVIVSVGYGEGPEIAERPQRGGLHRLRRTAHGRQRDDPLRLRGQGLRQAGRSDGRLHPPRHGREGGGTEAARRASGDALLLRRRRDRSGAGGAGRQAGVRCLSATEHKHTPRP